MDSSQRALQTNGKLISNFEFIFELMSENQKILHRMVRLEY